MPLLEQFLQLSRVSIASLVPVALATGTNDACVHGTLIRSVPHWIGTKNWQSKQPFIILHKQSSRKGFLAYLASLGARLQMSSCFSDSSLG